MTRYEGTFFLIGKTFNHQHTLHFSTLVGGKNLGDVKKGVFGSLKSNFGGCMKYDIDKSKLSIENKSPIDTKIFS